MYLVIVNQYFLRMVLHVNYLGFFFHWRLRKIGKGLECSNIPLSSFVLCSLLSASYNSIYCQNVIQVSSLSLMYLTWTFQKYYQYFLRMVLHVNYLGFFFHWRLRKIGKGLECSAIIFLECSSQIHKTKTWDLYYILTVYTVIRGKKNPK
jgi:hypothetical protein